MEKYMDGKYNKILDSMQVRFALWAVCFTAWAGVSYGLLKIAV